jgi:gamma-glutamyltranspeptidase / glutathione hydrolase
MNTHRKENAGSCGADARLCGPIRVRDRRTAAPMRIAVVLGVVLAAGCHASPTPRIPTPAVESAAPQNSAPTAAAVPARLAATFPAGWRTEESRPPTVAPHAMIASNSALASAAGVAVMRQGGNAVDAAVAVGFALSVTYPEAGNIGGGGFMVIRMADGRVASFDYREMAPLAATATMYAHADGTVGTESLVGPLAVGVPGAVAGLAAASKAFGRLPLRAVLAPAIRLARDGFVVDSAFYRSVSNARGRIAPFAGASVFLANGRAPAIGTRFTQPALARTLTLIAERGADAFYRGPIASAIADEMHADGGIITREDLARYTPVRRAPLTDAYRGYTLIAMPPPSSGGVTIIEALNILETYPVLPPFGSTAYVHVVSDAYQRAFIDRNGKLGDPAFVSVPVATLTDKRYAQQVRATIGDRAQPTSRLAQTLAEGSETTHYSVVDADGNAVATTTTLNDLYGSGVYVRAAGFFLNDEMDDFVAHPGVANQFGLVEGPQNAIAPGKRMLSSMAPTIVLDSAGQVFLVVGGRGGPRIVTSTAAVIINAIDYRMDLADALAAPRIHHQGFPDLLRYERNGLTGAVRDSLTALGYALAEGQATGTCTAVMRVAGGYQGAVDPRSRGGAVGY